VEGQRRDISFLLRGEKALRDSRIISLPLYLQHQYLVGYVPIECCGTVAQLDLSLHHTASHCVSLHRLVVVTHPLSSRGGPVQPRGYPLWSQ